MVDIILSLGGFILAASLIPTFKSGQYPALLTSLTISVVMAAFVASYLAEGLPLAAISSFINGLLWTALAIERYRANRYI